MNNELLSKVLFELENIQLFTITERLADIRYSSKIKKQYGELLVSERKVLFAVSFSDNEIFEIEDHYQACQGLVSDILVVLNDEELTKQLKLYLCMRAPKSLLSL